MMRAARSDKEESAPADGVLTVTFRLDHPDAQTENAGSHTKEKEDRPQPLPAQCDGQVAQRRLSEGRRHDSRGSVTSCPENFVTRMHSRAC
jgi:hypothetical protein